MHPGMYRNPCHEGAKRFHADVRGRAYQVMLEQTVLVVHATEAQLILDELFYVSGEIRVSPRSRPVCRGQYRRTEDG